MVNPGAVPARLGRYELLARLATGGMGEIFVARLEGAAGFEKLFVIKRILPHLADDPRFRAMLIGEARVASMMTHANICHVYELGETEGQLYIVMEYLEGITVLPLLRKLSKEASALDLGFAAGVIQQATDGLHYAHELKDRSGEYLGIVHRDVTPSNIYITDAGVVKVLDFGIAKVRNASAHTQTGTVKGKYAYMAPEQLRGATVDRRADVFALGVVVYEMLALRRLFQRKTDYLTFRAVMEQPIIDIRRYRPDCPDPLARVLAQALDRDPANRFSTARQFGSAVLDAVASVRRPWSHGEISDFMGVHFARDIKERTTQVARAIRSGVAPLAIPVIAQPDDETTEIEDSMQDFPPVGSETETPVDVRHLRGPSDEHIAMTDPQVEPLGDPLARPPQLEALRGVPGAASQSQQPAPIVVLTRRSVVWPLFAFAMVMVAGGALYLVWHQMQNQQPTSVVITHGNDRKITEQGPNTLVVAPTDPEPIRAAKPAADVEPARPPPDPEPAHPTRRNPPPDRYNGAVQAKQADVNRCVSEHGQLPPGAGVMIVVAPNGHPKTISFEPDSIDNTPLGTCLKNVFKTAAFPRGLEDEPFFVKLVRRA